MSFDEQPDGDPHGECAAEIHRLEAENAKLLEHRDALLIDLAASLKRRDELRKDAELANDTFAQIINWCRAYPLVVFPEPDFKKAHAVLLTAGITLDAVSASNMRHVLKGVEQIIIGAQGVAMLAKHSPEDEIERARRMV